MPDYTYGGPADIDRRSYRPSDDFIARLSGYLAMADDSENPRLQ